MYISICVCVLLLILLKFFIVLLNFLLGINKVCFIYILLNTCYLSILALFFKIVITLAATVMEPNWFPKSTPRLFTVVKGVIQGHLFVKACLDLWFYQPSKYHFTHRSVKSTQMFSVITAQLCLCLRRARPQSSEELMVCAHLRKWVESAVLLWFG